MWGFTMKEVRYFYNYNAAKVGKYDQFNHGILTSSDETGDKIHERMMKIAREKYPDADNINITALNRI